METNDAPQSLRQRLTELENEIALLKGRTEQLWEARSENRAARERNAA